MHMHMHMCMCMHMYMLHVGCVRLMPRSGNSFL